MCEKEKERKDGEEETQTDRDRVARDFFSALRGVRKRFFWRRARISRTSNIGKVKMFEFLYPIIIKLLRIFV